MKESAQTQKTTQFLKISSNRLLAYNLITLGFYQLYWFYCNWNAVRSYQNRKIWPVARSIFSIFFVIQLFNEIFKTTKFKTTSSFSSATNLGLFYIILAVLSVITTFPNQNANTFFTVISLLATVAAFLVLLPIQNAINNSKNQTTVHETGSGEKIILVVGVIFAILGLIGLSLPS